MENENAIATTEQKQEKWTPAQIDAPRTPRRQNLLRTYRLQQSMISIHSLMKSGS